MFLNAHVISAARVHSIVKKPGIVKVSVFVVKQTIVSVLAPVSLRLPSLL